MPTQAWSSLPLHLDPPSPSREMNPSDVFPQLLCGCISALSFCDRAATTRYHHTRHPAILPLHVPATRTARPRPRVTDEVKTPARTPCPCAVAPASPSHHWPAWTAPLPSPCPFSSQSSHSSQHLVPTQTLEHLFSTRPGPRLTSVLARCCCLCPARPPARLGDRPRRDER